jgi:hypothetical protein
LQIRTNIAFKFIIITGFCVLFLPGRYVTAQIQNNGPGEKGLTISFLKQEINTKSGDLSFNIIRAVNQSDSAIRFKPIFILPTDWLLFSIPYNDTVISPHDSISLIYRFKVPENVSSEVKYEIFFRAYSMKNKLLEEKTCPVYPQPNHSWEITMPENRVFFSPRKTQKTFDVTITNNGNIAEEIDLQIAIDKKLELESAGNWQQGQPITLGAFQDTVLKFNVKYINKENRVFDLTKIQFDIAAGDKLLKKPLMIEKYSDTYSPFVIDRSLPHQVEIGFRTFSGNKEVLPFIKARGMTSMKKQSTFTYNFNYYSVTGNEDLVNNTYYNFLYSWKTLKVGLGAFGSQLGRNLYTRNGLMVSNTFKFSKTFSMEAFLSQSILAPKTSVATGFTYEKKKIGFHGTLAYDIDKDKNMNTGSGMIQSSLIPLFKNQDFSFNIYGFHEYHDVLYDYTLAGVAWDLNYFIRIGESVALQLTNNYGTPNIPGTQMGLFSFSAQSAFTLADKKKYFTIKYINSSRDYYSYSFEGFKMPNSQLYDQYTNILFHTHKNPNHVWEAGPSLESYISYRPIGTIPGMISEYRTQNLRFEYKGVIHKNLMLDMKTGLSNIHLIETTETKEQRYDFHLLGGFSFWEGYGVYFNYDYGPMVNTGLYQYAGDAKNHSINVGPSLRGNYFNDRVVFNLFANLTYRIDMNYSSVNINPKIEAYLFRDWYLVMSGTYHYTMQEYTDVTTRNSYTYLECSLKKRWGKSDFNKWQKDTRKLRVVLFKDDNGNGAKDPLEQGIPYVKTRVVLTNTDNPTVSTQFPVDITLLSNEKGMVYYNKLPIGFYELSIVPLGDVKEYFYVNKSVEKLELTKNLVYYVPFQKATKITGKLIVERQKYIKKGTELIDLENIKITAFSNQGNSYSSFTLDDGTFTIFVPGNNTYYMRMGNVFGPGFKILRNDIPVILTDTASQEIVFNVQEITRQIKFKETKAAPADSLQQEPLKIKVLHGKFYENSNKVPVDKDAIPEFNIKESPVTEQALIPGEQYVVIGKEETRTEAVKLIRVVGENGIEAYLGYNEQESKYIVYTKHFDNKGDAREELDLMRFKGLNEAEIVKF